MVYVNFSRIYILRCNKVIEVYWSSFEFTKFNWGSLRVVEVGGWWIGKTLWRENVHDIVLEFVYGLQQLLWHFWHGKAAAAGWHKHFSWKLQGSAEFTNLNSNGWTQLTLSQWHLKFSLTVIVQHHNTSSHNL